MELQMRETEKLIEERKKVDDIRIRYRQKKHQLEEKEKLMLKQQQLNANDCVLSDIATTGTAANNNNNSDEAKHQEDGPPPENSKSPQKR